MTPTASPVEPLPVSPDLRPAPTPKARRGGVARHVAEVPPSGIRRFFEMVVGMPDVVSLGVGEPDFPAPLAVREEGIRRLQAGQTTYTSNYGLPELRRALAVWLKGRYNLDYDPATEMIMTVGASEAIDIALRAILDPGDEVIVVEPCYVSYAPSVSLAGGVPVRFPTWQKDDFRLNMDELAAACGPRTKAILLNYPSNPTGATLRRADLERLSTFVQERGILVLSDEIYAELTYGDEPHVSLGSLPGMKDHTFHIGGFSKAFAMTGWRLGYVCAPPDLIAAMVKIHQYAALCAPTLAQYGALVALERCMPDVEAMRQEYDRRRCLIVDGFNALGLKTLLPEGAFYAFASIEGTGYTSEDFCMELLKAEKVAVVPGEAFGESGRGMIRACYATSTERIETALAAMGRFLGR